MIDPSVPADLQRSRYGVGAERSRAPFLVVLLVVMVFLGGWIGWSVWHDSGDTAGARVHSYDVVSAHQMNVTLDVHHRDGRAVDCTVTAVADDHSVVGQSIVHIPGDAPADSTVEVSIKTERTATTADVVDCA